MFIESTATETEEQFRAFLTELLTSKVTPATVVEA